MGSAAAAAELWTPLGMAACEADAETLRFMEDITSRADEVQREVLAEILRRDADTEYLRRHGMGGATDRETFKSKIPVSTYEDLMPDILRIASGDRSPILCAVPIRQLISSSGTSAGKSKLIPTTEKEIERHEFARRVIKSVNKICFPGSEGGKILCFYFTRMETETAAGLPVRSTTTNFYRSEGFRRAAREELTSPIAAILCYDVFQSMYAQLLCGLLRRRDVGQIRAIFAPALLRAVRFLQLHWRELAADIAAGELTDKVSDTAVREAVAEIMTQPDPDLAGFITNQCSGDNDWEGIIPRIWPDAKYLDVIVTGAMAQYVPMLEFYGGGLPIVSPIYASSEGMFGVNLRPSCDPRDVTYTIVPNMAYFEFVPYQDNPSSPSSFIAGAGIVDLTGVEVGKEYELVVTTYNGLWRYRIGDVFKVAGFHNASPELQFVRRSNVLLSIDSDKTDETELQAAVERASALLRRRVGATVVDYTSRVDLSVIPGRYVIYWELELQLQEKMPLPLPEVLEACCLEMEEAMGPIYREKRAALGSIAPLEIRVVAPGTFEALMDFAVSSSGGGAGASYSQYKTPRCVTFNGPFVGLLDARVVSAHISQSCPRVGPV